MVADGSVTRVPARAARPSTVVFDVGGVLLDWNPRHLYRKVFDDDVAMERFLGTICTPQWHDPHDRGASTADSCARLAEAHPEHADEIWAWMTRGEEMVAGAFDDTVEILTELTRWRCRLLRTQQHGSRDLPPALRAVPLLQLVRRHPDLGPEGMAKPDDEIFELLLERFGLRPGPPLFIDDNVGNLDPASALGMSTRALRIVGGPATRPAMAWACCPGLRGGGRRPDPRRHVSRLRRPGTEWGHGSRQICAPEGDGKKRRIRTAVFRSIMRVGFLRHFYVRRLLRFMEKSKAKGRALPPELFRLEQMLGRLPPPKRAEALESALLASPDETPSREMRRAAARQDRLRSDGGGTGPVRAPSGHDAGPDGSHSGPS
jgi:2-haloacid dehalogenase